MTPEGKIILVDVKSLHGGKLGGRTEEQKRLGVQFLRFNSTTRKMKFVEHQK